MRTQIKNIRYSMLSLITGIICIVGMIIFNYKLSLEYLSQNTKSQFYFGLIELERLETKLYFIPLATLSVIFAIIAFKVRELKWLNLISLVISIFSVISLFRIWRLMV